MTGLNELIVAFELADRALVPKVAAVTGRGGLGIKRDWQRRWSGIAHAQAIPQSIDYDTHIRATEVRTEVGPNRSRGPHLQGFLGAIIEYGGIHSGPVPGGVPAADAEEPRFERALADLAATLLAGGRG